MDSRPPETNVLLSSMGRWPDVSISVKRSHSLRCVLGGLRVSDCLMQTMSRTFTDSFHTVDASPFSILYSILIPDSIAIVSRTHGNVRQCQADQVKRAFVGKVRQWRGSSRALLCMYLPTFNHHTLQLFLAHTPPRLPIPRTPHRRNMRSF